MDTTTEASSPGSRGADLLPVLPGVIFLLCWQLWSMFTASLVIPGPVDVARNLAQLVTAPAIWRALWISNQALIFGYFLGVTVGLPIGLLMGRVRAVEKVMEVWIGIVLVTPMAMMLPIIIMAIGFDVRARALVVFVFCVPMVIVNAHAGVRSIDKGLLDMARSFRATESQLWRKILLPGAAPAIWTGLRIGLGRAITGMVIVELLLVAAGVGFLIMDFRSRFNYASLYSVIIIVVLEALILLTVMRLVERRLVPWASPGGIDAS